MLKQIKTKNIFKTLIFLAVFVFIFSPFIIQAAQLIKTPEEIAAAAALDKSINDALCIPNPFCWVPEALTALFRGFLAGILAFCAGILWLAGSLLDFVIEFTIVNMTSNISGVTAINGAWAALRDLANIFFIFILLYIAIATVLNLQGGNMRKLLSRVIIIALLINFSFFFTRVIIDISNTVSVGFYSSMSASNTNPSLATAYMNKLWLTTFYKVDDPDTLRPDLVDHPMVAIMGSVLFLVTAFIFLSAVGLFVTRYVVLIFLMVLSAPAFAAMALPNDKYSSKWWDALWSQVLFAPIFFILSWVTLHILTGVLGSLVQNPDFVGALVGIGEKGAKIPSPDAKAIFLNFSIVIAFMISSLVAAKFIAGSTGKGITNFVNNAVGRTAIGGAAWLGRNTFGRVGSQVLKNEKLKDLSVEGNFVTRNAARLALSTASNLNKSSFDAANIKTFGAGGAISGNLGLGKGSGKGGFAEYEKQQKEKAKKFAELLKPGGQLKDQIGDAVKRSDDLTKQIKLEDKQFETKEKEIRKQIVDQEIEETPELKALREQIKLTQFASNDQDKQKAKELQKQEQELIQKIKEEKIKTAITTEKSRVDAEKSKMTGEIEKLKPLAETTQRRAEGIGRTIRGEWWSQTRGVRAEAAQKALKEKTKEEKAIDAIKEGIKEEGGGKEKDENDEKK